MHVELVQEILRIKNPSTPYLSTPVPATKILREGTKFRRNGGKSLIFCFFFWGGGRVNNELILKKLSKWEKTLEIRRPLWMKIPRVEIKPFWFNVWLLLSDGKLSIYLVWWYRM